MRTVALLLAIATAATAAGCARSHGTVKLSPDMYMIHIREKGNIVGKDSGMRSQVVAEANALARDKHLEVVPITTYGSYVDFAGFTTFDYQFRLVDAGSPATKFDPEKAKAFTNGAP